MSKKKLAANAKRILIILSGIAMTYCHAVNTAQVLIAQGSSSAFEMMIGIYLLISFATFIFAISILESQ